MSNPLSDSAHLQQVPTTPGADTSQEQAQDIEDGNGQQPPTSTPNVIPEDDVLWKKLLQLLEEPDGKMLKDWQDELANLLTFTGLFSAVVAGFVVFSLPTLQQDTGDRTVALLSQISQQISSFISTDHMTNSTFQPSLAPPFTPDPVDVHITTLFTISLTLSLMAAFWAITVQQWLRHIPLPPELTAGQTVRLRQLRHDGIMSWRVPTIVLLLPLVLQIAVLLFFAGLLLLLRKLDSTVARAYLLVVEYSLIFWVLVVLLPLFYASCPFKSPVIPTLYSLYRLLLLFLWPYILLGRMLVAVLTSLTSPLFYGMLKFFHIVSKPYWELRWDLNIMFASLANRLCYVVTLGGRDSSRPHLFWKSHELVWLRHSAPSIDASVVETASEWITGDDTLVVATCMEKLPERTRMRIAAVWICRELSIPKSYVHFWTELQHRWFGLMDGWGQRQLPRLFLSGFKDLHQLRITARLQPVLRQALPSDWTSFQRHTWVSERGAVAMSMLALWCADTLTSGQDAQQLVLELARVRRAQFLRHAQLTKEIVLCLREWIWLPTTLLFNCCLRGYETGSEDAVTAANSILTNILNGMKKDQSDVGISIFTNNQLIELNRRRPCTGAWIQRAVGTGSIFDALPGSLAAIATALYGTAHLHDNDQEIRALLRDFLELLNLAPIQECFHRLRHMRSSGYTELYVVDVLALKSIAQSLTQLSCDRRVGIDRALIDRLLVICSWSPDYSDAASFLTALQSEFSTRPAPSQEVATTSLPAAASRLPADSSAHGSDMELKKLNETGVVSGRTRGEEDREE